MRSIGAAVTVGLLVALVPGCATSSVTQTAAVTATAPTVQTPPPKRPPVKKNARPVVRGPATKQILVPAVHVPVLPAAPPQCADVPAVGGAHQVVLVRSSGSSATVEACTWDGARWLRSLGPYYGQVGYNGVAYGGTKREGDSRTPAGVYALTGGFGLLANPGLVFGWRPVGSRDVWVDDPTSALYNTWQQTPVNGRWRSAEPMGNPGAYSYAQVIAYNTARTPYAGSAIFLHVDGGGGTAGCVALPLGPLVSVFRWERPGVVIAIS